MAAALLSMGLAYLLFGSTSAFIAALVAAGLIGAGNALWHPAAAASLSGQFPERRATALAVHGMGATVSDTITPLAVGALLVTFSWQKVLELQIVPGLAIGFLVWRGLSGVLSEVPSRGRTQIQQLGDLMRSSAFLGLVVARGFIQMGRLVILTFLPIYLQEHLGYSAFVLGFYLTLLHAMGIVSQPVLGLLSDRFGRKALLLPSMITQGVLFHLLAIAAPGFQLGLVLSAIGAFFYTLMSVLNAAVMDVAGTRVQASSYGLSSLLTQFMVLPHPVAAGLLIGRYGIGSAFVLAGTFLLLAALAVAPLRLYTGSKN